VVEVVVTEREVLGWSLKVLVEGLSRADGEPSWLPPVLAKEWCWGRRKDCREAFAMDGGRTQLS